VGRDITIEKLRFNRAVKGKACISAFVYGQKT